MSLFTSDIYGSLESKITDVTVYLRGATITRETEIEIEEGEQSFVFAGLPSDLDADTLQVGVINDDEILLNSVEHNIDYLVKTVNADDVVKLGDELEQMRHKQKVIIKKIEICNSEIEFLEINRDIRSQKDGLSSSNFKEVAQFYRERVEINEFEKIDLEREYNELSVKINNVTNQLGMHSGQDSVPVSNVRIEMYSPIKKTIKISLSYYIQNAGWSPLYDIRAIDVSGDIKIHFKANIYQNSNENWVETKLILSTGTPSKSGDAPELYPWYIDFQQPVQAAPIRMMDMKSRSVSKVMYDEVEAVEDFINDERAMPHFEVAAVSKTLTSVEYSLKNKCTILSGRPLKGLEVAIHSLPAKYHYYSVRKLDKEVYLLAAVEGWEQLNLIEGEGNVYFEGKFVGKTYINLAKAEEEFELSLGIDSSVIVNRVKGKDFTSKALIGSSTTRTRQWELSVRNLKEVPIDITLVDQIPVATNKQIQVDAVELSGAKHDVDSGKLTWELKVEPAEVKQLSVKYTVAQPKNTVVTLE